MQNLYIMLGTSNGLSREQVMEIYPRHKVVVDKYIESGELINAGPFIDSDGGNMGIFRSLEGAQNFVAEDPFKLEGAVKEYIIKPWIPLAEM